MRRWDLILAAAITLATLAAAGVDWRAGAAVLAVCLGGVWYLLGDVDEDG